MTAVNRAIVSGFDLLLGPASSVSPWLGVVVLSLVTAVVALLIFRHTSNQRAIKRIKDLIVSHLLEIALYRDDLRVVLRAQRAVLWHNLRYLTHALIPLACMMLPVAILLLQGDLRYGHRPLRVGEQAIVAVKLRPGAEMPESPSIQVSSGLAVETPPLRIPFLHEVDWRIRGLSTGRHDVRILADGAKASKLVAVERRSAAVSTETVEAGTWRQLLHPGEAPLPANGGIASIRISYPGAPLPFFGRELHWVWAWLTLSLVFGYLLRGPLRVQL